MKCVFHLVHHAFVAAHSSNTLILMDPWNGKTFHFDTYGGEYLVSLDPELINATNAIHISHLHEDHFCAETLNLFNRDIPIYICEIPNKELYSKIKNMGFKKIIEIPPYLGFAKIGPFTLRTFASTHFNTTQNTSLLVTYNNTENYYFMNDCRLSNFDYLKMTKLFGPIHGAFLTLHEIGPYPYCYDQPDKINSQSPIGIAHKKNLDDFLNIARLLRCKWIVSYANGVRLMNPRLENINSQLDFISESLPHFSEFEILKLEPGQSILKDGIFCKTEFRHKYSAPMPIKRAIGKKPSIEYAKNYLLDILLRNLDDWPDSTVIEFKISNFCESFKLEYNQNSRLFSETKRDPNIKIEYSPSEFFRVLAGELRLIDLNYMFALNVTMLSKFTKPIMVHRWR